MEGRMPTWARVLVAAVVAVVGACAAGPAAAQSYPTRPVTIVVPFAAGGGNDILARLLGQHMGRALGQQFVIENRGGAAGTIGARAVAKAGPGKITYATAGVGSGSHISTELLASMADIKLAHIPYRGSGPAQADLAGGHVVMAIQTIPPAIAQIRSGLVRA